MRLLVLMPVEEGSKSRVGLHRSIKRASIITQITWSVFTCHDVYRSDFLWSIFGIELADTDGFLKTTCASFCKE